MKTRLDEAFKISVEIDPEDMKSLERGQGVMTPTEKSEHNEVPESAGKFGQYVAELSNGSRVERELREMAGRLNEAVLDILEDVALREDRRSSNAAQAQAYGRVLREWRAFLREFAAFERRFR